MECQPGKSLHLLERDILGAGSGQRRTSPSRSRAMLKHCSFVSFSRVLFIFRSTRPEPCDDTKTTVGPASFMPRRYFLLPSWRISGKDKRESSIADREIVRHKSADCHLFAQASCRRCCSWKAFLPAKSRWWLHSYLIRLNGAAIRFQVRAIQPRRSYHESFFPVQGVLPRPRIFRAK